MCSIDGRVIGRPSLIAHIGLYLGRGFVYNGICSVRVKTTKELWTLVNHIFSGFLFDLKLMQQIAYCTRLHSSC